MSGGRGGRGRTGLGEEALGEDELGVEVRLEFSGNREEVLPKQRAAAQVPQE